MMQSFARRTVRKELTRKEMLALGLLSGAALFLPLERRARTQLAVDLLPAAAVPLWDADLAERFPPVARPVGKRGLTDYYEITQKKALQQILPGGLPETEVWGYDGLAPGPTFFQRVGRKTVVRQINDTGDRHTSTHLHGNATPPPWDGYAPDMTNSGQFKDYRYPNNQDARTLWYHDHGMHETGENAYMGLAGFYITHDELEDSLGLPTGDYDIPLLIQDKAFTTDGSLFFDTTSGNNQLGNIILVNGVPWPRLRVEPRKYVFRILNGSISRGYNLRLSTGGTMTVVGHDGGVDPTPSPITSFRIGPAERYEIVVDFSPYASTPGGPDNPVILENLGVRNAPADAQTTGQIIRFDVGSRVTDDTNNGPVPPTLNPGNHAYSPMKFADPGRTDRQFIFERGGGADAPWVIAVGPDGPGLNFDENRVDANPELDAVEVWEFTNNSGGWFHPIHTHLIDFKILSRTGGDAPLANNGVHPWEGGPKDVTYVGEGESVRVIAKFGPQKGKYLMHCHNLIHEDHDMMTQFEVGIGGPDPVTTDPARPIGEAGPLVPPNAVPTVIPVSPRRGGRTRRRRPLIQARIFDAEAPLTAANIELTLDSLKRPGFAYDPGAKLMTFRPGASLTPGRHRVRVRARDTDGGTTTREWGFTIIP